LDELGSRFEDAIASSLFPAVVTEPVGEEASGGLGQRFGGPQTWLGEDRLRAMGVLVFGQKIG
jgi:hypothetical protein